MVEAMNLNSFRRKFDVGIHRDWIKKAIGQVHVNEIFLKILAMKHHSVKSVKEIHTKVQKQRDVRTW
jgi:transcription antitermination factor NusA-like protein